MKTIIGRDKEKQILEELYRGSKPEFVAVYGRRRVGKTFLVRELFGDRFSFYHTGLSPMELGDMQLLHGQLKNFSYSLAKYGAEITSEPEDWMDAFNILIEYLEQNRTMNDR